MQAYLKWVQANKVSWDACWNCNALKSEWCVELSIIASQWWEKLPTWLTVPNKLLHNTKDQERIFDIFCCCHCWLMQFGLLTNSWYPVRSSWELWHKPKWPGLSGGYWKLQIHSAVFIYLKNKTKSFDSVPTTVRRTVFVEGLYLRLYLSGSSMSLCKENTLSEDRKHF